MDVKQFSVPNKLKHRLMLNNSLGFAVITKTEHQEKKNSNGVSKNVHKHGDRNRIRFWFPPETPKCIMAFFFYLTSKKAKKKRPVSSREATLFTLKWVLLCACTAGASAIPLLQGVQHGMLYGFYGLPGEKKKRNKSEKMQRNPS